VVVANPDPRMKSAFAASVCVVALDAVAGLCTGDERKVLRDMQLVGLKGNECGVKFYNTGSFTFHHVEFNQCFSDSLGVSLSCAECYASVVEYGMRNCSTKCSTASGWCASDCITCTAVAWENRAALGACAGFTDGGSELCNDAVPDSAVNSSDTESDDRCSVCTDDCSGCPGHEKPADNLVVKFFLAHTEEFKSQAQELATQQGLNEELQAFVPIRYATQIVAGTNWFVKVQIGATSRASMYADVLIFEALEFKNQLPKVIKLKLGVARDAPISFGTNETVMV